MPSEDLKRKARWVLQKPGLLKNPPAQKQNEYGRSRDRFEGNEMIRIEICMGSSCFARGNRRTLEILEEHLKEQDLASRVELSGRLCLERCSCGPHIIVDGDRFDLVAPEGVLEILAEKLGTDSE